MNDTGILITTIAVIVILALVIIRSIIRKKRIVKDLAYLKELESKELIRSRDRKAVEETMAKMNYKYTRDQFNDFVKKLKDFKIRLEQLCEKYGEEIAVKILQQEYWIGMTEEQLIESKGKPTKIEKEILKTKTKLTYIYGNKSSEDYFVFEEGKAVKIVDR